MAQSSTVKIVPSVWFSSEIQQMMHGFGDCNKPLLDSASLIEQIVHEQLVIALYKAEEVAKQRSARFIGIEDFLFLLRRDKIKLRRLVKYMELKDMKKMMYRSVDEESENSENEAKFQPKKRKKICYDFLANIDQTGEILSIFTEDNFFDEIKHERALRAEMMSKGMDSQQYLDFCTARQTSFIARYKPQKFRDWLFQGIVLEVKPNPIAVETLSYLAYEIVAQIMDLSLIVRRDMGAQCEDAFSKVIPHVMVNYDVFKCHKTQHFGTSSASSFGDSGSSLKKPSSVPSSPTDSASLTPSSLQGSDYSKTKISKKRKIGAFSAKELYNNQPITVAHIHEAIRRYGEVIGPFSDNCSMKSSNCHLLCF